MRIDVARRGVAWRDGEWRHKEWCSHMAWRREGYLSPSQRIQFGSSSVGSIAADSQKPQPLLSPGEGPMTHRGTPWCGSAQTAGGSRWPVSPPQARITTERHSGSTQHLEGT